MKLDPLFVVDFSRLRTVRRVGTTCSSTREPERTHVVEAGDEEREELVSARHRSARPRCVLGRGNSMVGYGSWRANGVGKRPQALPISHSAPLGDQGSAEFTLLDTEGGEVRLSALRGRAVLLSFSFTHCSTACPLLTQQMALLQAHLTDAGVPAHHVHFLSITVDPERDSADALGRYAERFGADRGRWQFLREEPQRLAPVLSAYDEWRRPLANGDIDHPASLYLIDQRGRVREIYSLALFDERQAFRDIQTLPGSLSNHQW